MPEEVRSQEQPRDETPDVLLAAIHHVANTIIHETKLENAERATRIIGHLGEALRQYLL